MIKVCMLTQSSYPGDPRVKREAEALERRGGNVDVICLREKGEKKFEQYGTVRVFRVIPAMRQENLVRYLFVAFSFFISAFIKLQVLAKEKYDLIQIHNMPDWLVFAAVVQKLRGVPVVLDIHDLTPELFESKWVDHKHTILSKIVRTAEKYSCKFADNVITVTEGCKDRLAARGVPEEKITLVLNTPDTSIFVYDSSKKFDVITEEVRIIYHGTMAHRFGVHVAIEAMPLIRDQIPGAKLILYGKYDYDYYLFLQNLVKELELENNVELNKSIPLEEIAGLLKTCDIGVVPYLSTPYMNLALSTKTFEYAGAGLPVIATKLETLYKTFGSESISYVNPGDAHDLFLKVMELCHNPQLRKSYTENAYASLQEISGDVMSKKYVDMMLKAASKNKKYTAKQPPKSAKPGVSYSGKSSGKHRDKELIN